MRYAAVPIFVPHAGCPRQCIFCDQRVISGQYDPPSPLQVQNIIENAMHELHDSVKPAKIAFFGGSFTAIDHVYMVSLLQCVQKYLDGHFFSSVRISTRPDAIDEKILKILHDFHVTDIELGVQSLCDDILRANRRGHLAGQIAQAVNMIRESGQFSITLQIMTGLYKDNTDITLDTAKRVIQLRPDAVRIYPAVVLRGTVLEELYQQGEYQPQTISEAVLDCADLLELFTDNGIPVIKLGLHDGPELHRNIVAGPYHPAFRELCESKVLMKNAMLQIADNRISKGNIKIYVSPGSISKMIGQKRENLQALADKGYHAKVFSNSEIGYLKVQVL